MEYNQHMQTPDDLQIRWLGAAGLEFRAGEQLLLVDPFFTRPMMWKNLFFRVAPDRALIRMYIQRAEGLFIPHAHYDHALDAAAVQQQCACPLYGPPNACRLASVAGAAPESLVELAAGDSREVAGIRVEVFAGTHGPTPLDFILDRPLPRHLSAPLRLTDFRMDTCLAYRFNFGGLRVMVGMSPEPADLVILYPLADPAAYLPFLRQSCPRWVLPIHWDSFFRRLDRPLRGLFRPPTWRSPLPRRVRIEEFCDALAELVPQVEVLRLSRPFQGVRFRGGSSPEKLDDNRSTSVSPI